MKIKAFFRKKLGRVLIERVEKAVWHTNSLLREDMVYFCVRYLKSDPNPEKNNHRADIYFLSDLQYRAGLELLFPKDSINKNVDWKDEWGTARINKGEAHHLYEDRDIYVRELDPQEENKKQITEWLYAQMISHEILHQFGFEHRDGENIMSLKALRYSGMYLYPPDENEWRRQFHAQSEKDMKYIRKWQKEYAERQERDCYR